MLLKSIRAVASTKGSFLFIAEVCVTEWIHHSLMDTWVVSSFGAVMNQAAVCIHIQVLVDVYLHFSRNEIAGLCGTCIFIFIGN